jgi:uncharacterized membrane-anchored protein
VKRYLLPIAFAALLALQVLPSATLAWQQTQRLNHGRSVQLAVETRDPRDLFRGEYSVLAYEVGRLQGISAASIPPGCDLVARESCRLKSGTAVYVRLTPDAEGVHRASEVLFEVPTETDVVIAGRLGSGTLVRQGTSMGALPRGAARTNEAIVCERPACISALVSYGIENWYGPQGVPAKLDRAERKDIVVEARVASDGVAAIDGIVVGGIPFVKTARLW